MERRIIFFSGNVQGVGFRYTTVQMARDLDLAGIVRNLDDGRVELDVEGTREEIDELVSRLREHFGSAIRNVKQNQDYARGLARGIRISH